MKIRALLLALGMATVLTGCQNMDSNGLLSSGAEAFQAYTLSDAQVKALSDQSCQELDSKAKIAPRRAANTLNDWQKLPLRWGITLTASR
ncbi:Putative metalloprotease yggG [Salmonella enterica subsp. enterica]|nr:Putative metalloprotease yggG [Salmonella enterica subsp. enterica]